MLPKTKEAIGNVMARLESIDLYAETICKLLEGQQPLTSKSFAAYTDRLRPGKFSEWKRLRDALEAAINEEERERLSAMDRDVSDAIDKRAPQK